MVKFKLIDMKDKDPDEESEGLKKAYDDNIFMPQVEKALLNNIWC